MLYSEGFSGAKDLASKMVSLFLLSRQLLSQQQVRRRPLLSLLLLLSSLLLLCSLEEPWFSVCLVRCSIHPLRSTTTGVSVP